MVESSEPKLPSLSTIFNQKYEEFAEDLKGAVPEYQGQIALALLLSEEDRKVQFREVVLPGCAPTRDAKKNPGFVLPSVQLSDRVWNELSDSSKEAIQQHLTLLSFCSLYDGGKDFADLSGGFPFENIFGDWKKHLEGVDMNGFTEKFKQFMQSSAGESFGKIPEKFLKGQLAKLCEELVAEFKPEDFGLTEEQLKAYESEPQKVFELITEVFTKNPENLQRTIKRIATRFQEKFQKGQLRPEQIVAEAEELMKEFSSNEAFVQLLESFRSMFDLAGDMDMAKKTGREGSARSQLVRDRLRKKLDAKKKKATNG